MIRNVIFDLYGTLIDIDTDEKYEGFFEHVEKLFKDDKYLAGNFKKIYLAKCNEKSKEKEEFDLLEVFKEIFEVDDYEAYRIAWTFRLSSLNKIKLYPNVIWLLEALKNTGYNIYLLTNAQRCFTIFELYALGIEKYFDGIYISSDYGVKKPNKKFFETLIYENKLYIDECVMVGNDPFTDIEGAKNLDMKYIYVETETSTKDVLKPDVKGFNAKKIFKLIRR